MSYKNDPAEMVRREDWNGLNSWLARNNKSNEAGLFHDVGDCVYVQTPTFHYIGKIVAFNSQFLLIGAPEGAPAPIIVWTAGDIKNTLTGDLSEMRYALFSGGQEGKTDTAINISAIISMVSVSPITKLNNEDS